MDRLFNEITFNIIIKQEENTTGKREEEVTN
jgi:hypothetical protein